jgi:hypothetical protein
MYAQETNESGSVCRRMWTIRNDLGPFRGRADGVENI